MRIIKEDSLFKHSPSTLIIEDKNYFLSEVRKFTPEKPSIIYRADRTRIPGKPEPGTIDIIADNKLIQHILPTLDTHKTVEILTPATKYTLEQCFIKTTSNIDDNQIVATLSFYKSQVDF